MEQNTNQSFLSKIFFVLIGFGLSYLLGFIFAFLISIIIFNFLSIDERAISSLFFWVSKALNFEGVPLEVFTLSSIVVFLSFRRRQKFLAYGALVFFIYLAIPIFIVVVAHLLN